MDFQCPHCQNRLSVPDQYAGTLMKCPICGKNFHAPSLPPQLPPNIPANPAPSAPPTYGLAHEPPASAPSAPPPPSTSGAPTPPPTPSAPPAPRSTEYTNGFTLALDPAVLPWVAPGCLLVVFFLLFFYWVGQYAGGYAVNAQGGWGTAFGFTTQDEVKGIDFDKEIHLVKDPGVNTLVIFFILVLLPCLILAFAAAILPLVKVTLPPAVEQLKPWRWAIVAGVAFLALFFLTLQLILNFTIETALHERLEKDHPTANRSGEELKKEQILQGIEWNKSGMTRTSYLRLTWYLMVLATVCAALQFWLDRRPTAPIPRLEVKW